MKPICVECETEFRMEIAGIYVKEMYRDNKEVYKIHSADLWRCPKCGKQIVSGFGQKPLAQSFEEERMRELVAEIEEKGLTVIHNYERTGAD